METHNTNTDDYNKHTHNTTNTIKQQHNTKSHNTKDTTRTTID